jgi:hypothetical protein
MGQFLTKPVDGKTLYELAGVTPGPKGVIDKVTKRADAQANEDGPQFDVVVAGKPYALSMHPVMLHGSVDLGVWPGMTIGASWLAKENDGSIAVKIINVDNSHPMSTSSSSHEQTSEKAEVAGRFPVLPIVAVLFVAMLAIQFYMRKRRKDA